ncbi:MAG: phosphate acyltransferase PlsX [Chloroflexi bacterium]|nr:phosphate acyltransferase PlsX [Chloroflexota bacterium]
MDLSAVRTIAPDRVVRVAVDAMGGDHGPTEVVPGTVTYAEGHPADRIILVGDEERVRGLLGPSAPRNVEVVHAATVVDMDEHPAAAVRRKRDASINVCMNLVRSGEADAVVTAGHTGAGVTSAILHLHRLPGVDRPALAVQMVTAKGPFVLLDIGATTDSTGLNLAQYARMGALYAERVLGVARPSVALLSIGEEAGKGEARVQEATERLRGTDLDFIGNIEGRHLVDHVADVVVCDAAVGNVTIKFFEGLSSFILRGLLRDEFERDLRGRLAYLLLRPGIARIRDVFDYERLGGSPLLGVRGTVLITHGRARRRMISYAVAVGAAAARTGIPDAIADAFRAAPSATDAATEDPR